MSTIRTITVSLLCAIATTAGAQKLVGGDISMLPFYEESSAEYYDAHGNRITDAIAFSRSEGMNAMRVRLFVNPSHATEQEKNEGVRQDLALVKALGKRIKDADMSLLLDIHYSDTWADPSKQWTPEAWLTLDDNALAEQVYNYTTAVLQEMTAGGAAPDLIQTGNEISFGMLWGNRGTTDNRCFMGNTAHWERFGTLLRKATEACRSVCPASKIILHTERVAQPDVLLNFYQQMNALQVDYDIIGLSYYPYWHGGLDALETALNQLETTFPSKSVMVVETGYYHHYQPSDVAYDLSDVYPVSLEGQCAFTAELVRRLNNHASVTGLFWWFPEANEYGNPWETAVTPSGWYNAGLFDNETGHVNPAFFELKNFLNGATDMGFQTAIDPLSAGNQRVFTLNGQSVNAQNIPNGIYVVGNHRSFRKILMRR